MAGYKNIVIGEQSFENLIQGNHIYVDKTAHIFRLIASGRTYFLSRPRRFGKSLLLSTMQAIFEGKRELFVGLAINQSDYDWKQHPILLLNMSEIVTQDPAEFIFLLKQLIIRRGLDYGISNNEALSPGMMLSGLIEQLAKKEGKVVVLVDEYDKPVLDVIDDEVARAAIQNTLQSFYGALKAVHAQLRFLFITGVARFARTSIFSGLNHLNDISLDAKASTLLGYTDEEIDCYFVEHCREVQQKLGLSLSVREQLKTWYDGYKFHEDAQFVYNPFSVMSMLVKQRFANYWFATGTPTFLIKMLARGGTSLLSFNEFIISSEQLEDLVIENIDITALLFQTGYISIDTFNQQTMMYRLRVPNYEVRRSLFNCLLESYCLPAKGAYHKIKVLIEKLETELRSGELGGVIEYLKTVFATIPHNIHVAREAFYQTVFFSVLLGCGFDLVLEEATNLGQIDMVLTTSSHIYIFEFKMNQPLPTALNQIIHQRYWEKYALAGKTMILVGIKFSSQERNIVAWEWRLFDRAEV